MNKNINIKHDYFKTWSNNMAYILGFLAADGNVHLDIRKGYRYGRVYFSIHNNDKQLLYDIAKELGCNKDQVHDRNDESSSYLYVYSTEMYDDLVKLGITERKSLTLQWIDVPTQYLKHFIRGYFDGDGSLTEQPESKNSYKLVIQFLGTKDFLQGVINTVDKFLKIKDTGKKIENTKTRIYCLRYRCKQARTIMEWLYSDEGLKLNRKYVKFNEHLTRKKVQRLNTSSEVKRELQ